MAQNGRTARGKTGTESASRRSTANGSAGGNGTGASASRRSSGSRTSANGATSGSGRTSGQNGRSASGKARRRTSGQSGRSAASAKPQTSAKRQTGAKAQTTAKRQTGGKASARTRTRSTGGAGTTQASRSRPRKATSTRKAARAPKAARARKTANRRAAKPGSAAVGLRAAARWATAHTSPRVALLPLTAAGIGAAARAIERHRQRSAPLVGLLADPNRVRKPAERQVGRLVGAARAARETLSPGDAARSTRDAARDAARSTRKATRAARGSTRKATRVAGGSTRKAARDAARSTRKAARAARGSSRDVARTGQGLAERLRSVGGRNSGLRVPNVLQHSSDAVLAAAAPVAAYAVGRAHAHHRLPIQCSIDIAVPLEFVYDEWMKLEFLPEGAHCVEEIERQGESELSGQISGTLHSVEWHAEILDERDCDSFAWRSTSGSDCAGLITFHRLSDRLTRLELQLDVIPSSALETVELALGIADGRTEADLKKFKSRLETTSPEVYEDGSGSEHADHNDKED